MSLWGGTAALECPFYGLDAGTECTLSKFAGDMEVSKNSLKQRSLKKKHIVVFSYLLKGYRED